MFKTHFQEYACEGDTITCTVKGFEVTARIYRDYCGDTPEERQDGFWPSLDPKNAGYIGNKSKSTLARYMARAKETMRAWENDEWFYCGISLTVSFRDVQLTREYEHALWGIECNLPNGRYRTNGYLLVVANELLGEAIDAAESKLDELLSERGAA